MSIACSPTSTSVRYVDHPIFDQIDAAEQIAAVKPPAMEQIERSFAEGSFDSAIWDVPADTYVFLELNWRRRQLAAATCTADQLQLHRGVQQFRDLLVHAHLGLAYRQAQIFSSSIYPRDLLATEALLPLLNAIDLFDVSRGWRFSTYATHAIRNHLVKFVHRENRRRQRTVRIGDQAEPACSAPSPDQLSQRRDDLRLARECRDQLRWLADRDREILERRFGISGQPGQSYAAIGKQLGLSKERVRQLALRALARLRADWHTSA